MIIYIVKRYDKNTGKEKETVYKGNDIDRAQFYRNMYADAFITVTHSSKKH